MNRIHIKGRETDLTLPAIKKVRSTISSPRNTIIHSPALNLVTSASPVSRISPTIFINGNKRKNGLAEKFSNKLQASNLQLSLRDANKKVESLIKTIEEQDQYIRTLESEFNVSKNEFSLKAFKSFNQNSLNISDEKIETELVSSITQENTDTFDSKILEEHLSYGTFVREEGGKDKSKDYEIYKLRKQLEDNQHLIKKLTSDRINYKRKQVDYEEAKMKIEKIEQKIEEIKEESSNAVDKLKNEIYDKDLLLNCKIIDFNDMTELLKRSEDKRHSSNEYNTFMENTSAKLKDKVALLNNQRMKIVSEIEDTKKLINNKAELIENLNRKIEKNQIAIENERIKGSSLIFNYESTVESINDINAKNEILKQKYINEKEKYTTIQPTNKLLNDTKRVTFSNQPTTDQSKEETFQLQQKSAGLEKELIHHKDELEKLKKNEIYLSNQLQTKDLMIVQIESLMRETEEKEGKNNTNGVNEEKDAATELIGLVEDMKSKYKSSIDTLICSFCQKMPSECFLALPCGHLTCSNCKKKFEVACPQCSERVNGLIHAVSLDRIAYNFKKEGETIDRAKKLLGMT